MADSGDPRFAAPIWEGRYEVTPAEGVTLSSSTVMLTKANQCQLCGDAENVTAGEVFATLPEECRPARVLHLPVCVGGSGSETVSLEGKVTIAGQTATGEVDVPGQTASVELTIPQRNASGNADVKSVSASGNVTIDKSSATGTATVNKATGTGTVAVKQSEGSGTVNLSSEAGSDLPLIVSGEFDDSGELVNAYTLQVVNNTSPLSLSGNVDVTVPGQSIDVEVAVPAQSARVNVTIPEHSADIQMTVPAQTADVDVTVPSSNVTGKVEVADVKGTASVEIAEQEVPVTVSGTIATGGLATLTIGSDGTMVCSSGGTIYLDGFSYHICGRWY